MSDRPLSKRCQRCRSPLPAGYQATRCQTCVAAPGPSAGTRSQRAAAAPPEHLHPDALAATVVADGLAPVRRLLAATAAPELRAVLLADASARARAALEATGSPGRAVRRILDRPY